MRAERVPDPHDQVGGVDSIGELAHRRDHHLDVGVESLACIVGCPLDPVGHPGRLLRRFHQRT
jgi:hypothetical protein